MRKKQINKLLLLLTICFFVLIPTVFAENFDEDLSQYKTEANKVAGEPYLNPKWIKWYNLPDEEKAEWEIIPPKLIVDYIYKEKANKENIIIPYNETPKIVPIVKALPSTYNLKDEGYVSPIKNQGSLGLCWAFATLGAVESNALKTMNKNLIFSERQIDYALSSPSSSITEGYNPYGFSNRTLGDAGDFTYVNSLFLGGVSPQLTSTWGSYTTGSTKQKLDKVINNDNIEYYVTDTVNFPYINIGNSSETTKSAYRDMIKEHIMNYGGVYVSTIVPDSRSGSCYNSSYNMIYQTSDCTFNEQNPYHAMLIIGWNDTYGPDYNNDGVGDGAWILKNSWGTSDHPYPYLSYNSIDVYFSGVIAIKEKDWDRNYDDVDLGNTASSTRTFYKDNSTDEYLKRISFQNNYLNVNLIYNVYVSSTGLSNDKVLIGTVNADNPGIYSVDVNSILLNRDKFTIYVESQNNSNYRVNSISAFVSKVTETSDVKISTKVKDDYVFVTTSSSEQTFDLYSITENIATGEQLSYKFYNSSDEDVTSNFTLNNARIVNDNMISNVTFSSDNIMNGIYKVETYYNNKLLNTYHFEIGYIKVNKLTVSSVPELIVGEKHQLTTTILPTDAYNKTLNYESSDNNIVTVDENGLVTAIKEGTAKITITTTDGSNLSTTTDIKVWEYQMVKSLELEKDELTLLNGSTGQLTTKILPEDAYNKTLKYESSNNNIATVDENGLVTGVSGGTTEITVTATDRSNVKAKAKITVYKLNGDGTAQNPYQIYSQYDFDKIRYATDRNYIVMDDIEFNDSDYVESGYFYNEGKYWIPISSFNGTIDGNNKKLINLKMFTSDKTNLSIFENNTNANISNLTIDNVSIEGNYNVSTIAENSSSSTYKNIKVINSTLKGNNNGAGLLDNSSKDNVIDCRIENSTITAGYAGGLIYSATSDFILSSSSEVKIISKSQTGGLIGSLSESILMDSYTTSTIDLKNVSSPNYSENSIGGLIGYGGNSFIYNNYAITKIENYDSTKTYSYTGTLGGTINSSVIKNCYSSTNNENIKKSIAEAGYNNQSSGPSSGTITLDMIKGSLDENGELEFCSFNNCGENTWKKESNEEYITSKSNLVDEINDIDITMYNDVATAKTNGVNTNIAYPFNKMYEYSTNDRKFSYFYYNKNEGGSQISIDNATEVFYATTYAYNTNLSSTEFVPTAGTMKLKLNFNIKREIEITDFKLNLYDYSSNKNTIIQNEKPIQLIVNTKYDVSVSNILPENASFKYFSFEFDNDLVEITRTYDEEIIFIPKNLGTTILTIKAKYDSSIVKRLTFNIKEDYDIKSDELLIEDDIISKISASKNVSDVLNKLDTNSNVTLEFYKNGLLLENNEMVGTGSIIKTYKNEALYNEYKLIVNGDVTGDGNANATDILAQKLHILSKNLLVDEYFTAGDINSDGKVNALDILYLKRYILGKTENVWDN